MSTTQIGQTEIDQLIADEFGVNADYVSELLKQFERDRSSVDEEWRSFFDELLSNGRVATDLVTVAPSDRTTPAKRIQSTSTVVPRGGIQATYEWGRETATPGREPLPEAAAPVPAVQPQAPPVVAEEAVERIPIRGPALRIAENMEASLGVP